MKGLVLSELYGIESQIFLLLYLQLQSFIWTIWDRKEKEENHQTAEKTVLSELYGIERVSLFIALDVYSGVLSELYGIERSLIVKTALMKL